MAVPYTVPNLIACRYFCRRSFSPCCCCCYWHVRVRVCARRLKDQNTLRGTCRRATQKRDGRVGGWRPRPKPRGGRRHGHGARRPRPGHGIVLPRVGQRHGKRTILLTALLRKRDMHIFHTRYTIPPPGCRRALFSPSADRCNAQLPTLVQVRDDPKKHLIKGSVIAANQTVFAYPIDSFPPLANSEVRQ